MKVKTLEQHRQALEDLSNGRDTGHRLFAVFDARIKNISLEEALERTAVAVKNSVDLLVRDIKDGVDTALMMDILDDARNLLVDLAKEYNKPPVEFKLAPCKNIPLSEEAKRLQHNYVAQKTQRADRLKDLVAKNRVGFTML